MPGTRQAAAPRARRAAERRRRERHLRLMRRDLLVDVVLGLVVMVVMLIVTAGLGVIALIEIPVGLAIIGSFGLERWRRRRPPAGRRPQPETASPRGR